MRSVNAILGDIEGDAFGKMHEYFLGKFAITEGAKGGEYFTPTSIVDKRFPFGLPRSDNGNYIWIQAFYSALNSTGRAGFVMANSAADAGSASRRTHTAGQH